MNNIKVSFIVPVYNTKLSDFCECIKSITAIKGVSYEILIVDDGSNMQNSTRYKKIVNKYKQINYFYKSNNGVSSARNYGINKAKGEYVSFIDSDDITQFSKLNLKNILKNKSELIIFDVRKINTQNKQATIWKLPYNMGKVDNKALKKEILTDGILNWSVSKFYLRKFLLNKHIIFDENKVVGEDLFFVNSVVNNADNILYIPEIAYVYLNSDATGISRNIKYPSQVLTDTYEVYRLRLNISRILNVSDTQIQTKFSNEAIDNIYAIYKDWVVNGANISKELRNRLVYIAKEIKSNEKIELKEYIKYFIIRDNRSKIVKIINFIGNK